MARESPQNTHRRKTSPATTQLSFIEYLQAKLRDNAPKQKGARTRERLKIATAQMLEERGYHDMRVSDITQTAGVAEGSFYVYFNDKKDASLTVLREFLKDFIDLRAPPEAVHAPLASMRAASRRWLALARANSGLMRCVFQMGDENSDFARLVEQTNREWFERLSRSLRPDHQRKMVKPMLLVTYCLCSMMDEIIRKLIVHPDKEFLKLLKEWSADDNAVADAVSLIWLRVIGPSVKIPRDLPPIVLDLARLMWGQPKTSEKELVFSES